MKAITVYQPWASFLLHESFGQRLKDSECRDWSTAFRGTIAIHAAKSRHEHALSFVWREMGKSSLKTCLLLGLADASGVPFGRAVMKPYEVLNGLPMGCIIGTAELSDCIPLAAAFAWIAVHQTWQLNLMDLKRQFVFHLTNPRRLKEPIPYRGQQRIWNLPDEVLEGADYE